MALGLGEGKASHEKAKHGTHTRCCVLCWRPLAGGHLHTLIWECSPRSTGEALRGACLLATVGSKGHELDALLLAEHGSGAAQSAEGTRCRDPRHGAHGKELGGHGALPTLALRAQRCRHRGAVERGLEGALALELQAVAVACAVHAGERAPM